MKITITEKQAKFINEALDIPRLPSHLLSETNPLSNNPSIKGMEENLLYKRFEEVKGEFSDDISSYSNNVILAKLSKLLTKCLKKESNIRPQLERICINAIIDAFKIPEEGVNFDCRLTQEISSRTQFHISPDTDENFQYEDVESMDLENENIEKRKLTNALIVGGAMKIANILIKKTISEIFDLDEELPHLYSEIMKINDYLIFAHKFEIKDNSHKQGGYVTVKLGNDLRATTIEARAVIFPMLMIEVIRGCMEVWASHGLPDDIDNARIVINKADALENDPWYMRIGPVLWDKVYKFNDSFEYLPSFFSKLSELPNEEFFKSLKECFANTKAGDKKMAELMQSAKYEDDYSSFEYDIKQKQSEKGIIEDGYFTEEELDEAIYPESFIMDYFKSLSSFSQRILYCEKHLQRISSGSSRIVYKIDDNTVLKLAKNRKGLAQNEEEGQPDFYKDSIGLFAKVYDTDMDYEWIEMQLAQKAKPSDFKRLTGFDFNTVCCWIDYCSPNRYRNTNPLESFFSSSNFNENWDEYGLFAKLQEYIGNYDVPVGDLKRISSWGIVKNEGDEELVLIDYGLSNDILNNYYR